METSKLTTPLFYNGNFNREGRRMRAVLAKEISDGKKTYRLWRSAGKPDRDHSWVSENDKYLLWVEINGYLAPLGMTDYRLIDSCGYEPAAQKLYGGLENYGTWINALRESGGDDAVSVGVAEKQKEIERLGAAPARQTEYIQNLLGSHVSTYLKSKENGGQTFPDFIGALIMNELAKCVELSAVYRAKRQEENEAIQAHYEREEQEFCKRLNGEAEQTVSAALEIIRNGGVLKNETVTFYQGRHDSKTYSIFYYLMRQYQIDVPLRTRGWINEKLVNATIQAGKCERLQFFRSKAGRCSQKFFQCMNALIRAVTAQAMEDAT